MQNLQQLAFGGGISEFTEHDPRYYHCRVHIRIITVIMTCVTTLLAVICIVVGIAGLVSSSMREYILVDYQDISHFGEEHHRMMTLSYWGFMVLISSGAVAHICCLVMVFIAVKKRRPSLLIPEMVIIGLMIGLLVFVTVTLIIFMAILFGVLWSYFVLDLASLVYNIYYFHTIVRCYRYLQDKKLAYQQILIAYQRTSNEVFPGNYNLSPIMIRAGHRLQYM